MGLDALWQQCVNTIYQVWIWLRYEAGVHPFLFLGIAIIIVYAWILYRSEIRTK
jgi:drug/metabolite transporter superfamily protein YnfA